MTFDSAVSGAESRVGGFDVHQDDGTYTADTESPSQVEPPIKTGDTIKLRKLNEEVVEARQRQAHLAAQVERERAEVERLRLLKQQSLAREAAARVHPRQFTMGSGVSVGSNSTTKKSSTIQSGFRHSSGDSIYDEEPVKVSAVAERQLNNGKTVSRQISQVCLRKML
ncbi:hypothetical protein ANCDUO_08079 [Ancylostoma duodenale]|uniref:Uncharacterized protein n=1 Tax=Ancylostoma duodenale TaxID=51022 RepID=A0A0C2GRA8_9BILA|nr:hypothetical protein ANCDUO_08079 [Ancylostoma duodenale]